jgi:hypothetical protein
MVWYAKPFHWKFSSVFGVALWSFGVGGMFSDKYNAAFIFYFLGCVWIMGWWLQSTQPPKEERGRVNGEKGRSDKSEGDGWER